jgi:transposase
MSGPRTTSPQFDIVATTRRRWSREQKRAIVEEIDTTDKPVSEVARRHGIHSSQLFRWRRDLGASPAAASRVATFVPVVVEPCRQVLPSAAIRKSGTIEIIIAGGRVVRVGGDVDTAALVGIIEALEARR